MSDLIDIDHPWGSPCPYDVPNPDGLAVDDWGFPSARLMSRASNLRPLDDAESGDVAEQTKRAHRLYTKWASDERRRRAATIPVDFDPRVAELAERRECDSLLRQG